MATIAVAIICVGALPVAIFLFGVAVGMNYAKKDDRKRSHN